MSSRFHPRNVQSRRDSQIGPGHIFGKEPRQSRSWRDGDALGLYTLAASFGLASTQGNSVAASSVVAGLGTPVLITLSAGADQWASDLLTNTAKVNSLIAGLSGSGAAGIQAAQDSTVFSVDQTGTILSVKLKATAAYSIGAAQSYDWAFLEEMFKNRAGSITVTSAFVVKNGV